MKKSSFVSLAGVLEGEVSLRAFLTTVWHPSRCNHLSKLSFACAAGAEGWRSKELSFQG